MVTGLIAQPVRASVVATPMLSGRRAQRGICSGAPIDAKVPPGTPATANRPATRSGCSTASSNAVFTPIDQPRTGQRSTSASSSTASASSTNAVTSTRFRSAGRSEPPTPRWFHESTRTPQSERSSAGQAYGLVPRPLHSSTVGPSASLVHARSRVPSALVTS